MKSQISNLKSQISKFKVQSCILLLILLLGAFFRLYKINEYMTFLGDEGRDMLVVKRMIVDHKFTLLGPITSVGSMYMGPIYYYFMIPFLWLWNFDPVGPSIMVALFAVATIFLIYKLGADFLHQAVGLISAAFYAISPLPIISGRSSWNPNVVPFFAVLLIYSLLKVIVAKKYQWLALVGLSLGIVLQLHYVTAIFIPIIFVCLTFLRVKIPIRNYLVGLFAFFGTYSPFLLFVIRHQFVNLQAVIRFLLQQNTGAKTSFLPQFINIANDVLVRLFWRLIVIDSAEVAKVLILLILATIIIYWYKLAKHKENKLALKVLFIWLGVGIASFGIYRGVIYDYYLGSLFALPFLFTGIMIYTLAKYAKPTKILAVLIFLLLSFFSFKSSPLLATPNNLVRNTREIAEFVYQKTEGKPYNFALIAGKNSDHAYRYFLELWGAPPVTIENSETDPERKTVTKQLLIVCEEKVCQPLGHPLWEIAGFGRGEIAGEWNVVTAKVFRLVHYNKGE